MFRYIIWDFDGTLFDTYPAVADVFVNVLSTYGICEERKDILVYLHRSLGETFSHYSDKYGIEYEDLRNRFTVTEEGMDPSGSLPFPGASVLLEKVITLDGMNLIYTNRGNSIYNFLEHFGYTPYFREIITREDGFGRKPRPDCIHYFIDKYKLKKDDVLMVGDRELDVLAAKNAGIRCCYFNSHSIPIETNADIYIESLEELDEHI